MPFGSGFARRHCKRDGKVRESTENKDFGTTSVRGVAAASRP